MVTPRRSVPAGIAVEIGAPASVVRRPGQQGVHRRPRDGGGLRHVAQDRHEALDPRLAAEDEVGADDHGSGRAAVGGRRRGGRRGVDGSPTGSPDGSTTSEVSLGAGRQVRAGRIGRRGRGGELGTEPSPPVEPLQAASDGDEGRDDEDDRGHRRFMAGLLVRIGSESQHRRRRSQSRRREVTIRSQAAGARCAGRPRRGSTR